MSRTCWSAYKYGHRTFIRVRGICGTQDALISRQLPRNLRTRGCHTGSRKYVLGINAWHMTRSKVPAFVEAGSVYHESSSLLGRVDKILV